MKKFQFSLAGLMRLREYECNERLRKWKDVLFRIEKEEAKIEELQLSEQEIHFRRKKMRLGTFQSHSDRNLGIQMEFIADEVRKCSLYLKSLRQEEAELKKKYLKSKLDYKLVENLKERQLQAYLEEQRIEEENEMSDLFSARWVGSN